MSRGDIYSILVDYHIETIPAKVYQKPHWYISERNDGWFIVENLDDGQVIEINPNNILNVRRDRGRE